jgi:predicted DNA binding CopG/RHH family protein
MKEIPKFKSEGEEQKFWEECDSADYLEWGRARSVAFPNLKPSLKSISIRLPESMLEKLKVIANSKDVPYQSLMKVYLSEIIEKEYRRLV